MGQLLYYQWSFDNFLELSRCKVYSRSLGGSFRQTRHGGERMSSVFVVEAVSASLRVTGFLVSHEAELMPVKGSTSSHFEEQCVQYP